MADNGRGLFLQGKATGEGLVPGLRYRSDVWIHGGTAIEPACLGTGTTMGRFTDSAISLSDILGLLPQDIRVSGMPS